MSVGGGPPLVGVIARAAVCVMATAALAPVPSVGQMEIDDTGLTFPDGSVQTTAAADVVAWPQQCRAEVGPGELVYPVCYMYGGSDPSWSDYNGVPDGYFFLLTDLVITPTTTDGTDPFGFYVYHIGGCNNSGDGGTSLARSTTFRLDPEHQTLTAHFTSPLHVLPAGSCLRFDGFLANPYSTEFTALGFLTNDPSRFRP